MAKEFQVLKLNSPINQKKKSTQLCFNSLGFLHSIQFVNQMEKSDELKQSHQDLMKKYYQSKTYEQKQAALSTIQSQKTLTQKFENINDKLNLKLNSNKQREKENQFFRQPKISEIDQSINQIPKEKPFFNKQIDIIRLHNLKEYDKKSNTQSKVVSSNTALMDKRTLDPNIMPLSSLVRKSLKQKNQPQLLQLSSNTLFLKDEISGKVCFKQKSQSQQEVQRHVQDDLEDTLVQKDEIEKEINNCSPQFSVKKCFFSLMQGCVVLEQQNSKTRSLSNEKGVDIKGSKVSKSNRAHTQGKQEQKQMNRLYEYILEGNC
ncbi:unnamed protein product (macronuclear) [Paramecium tetraurelia]|uniref:Uncharacterized protein n=1 Tax=Paramecium tetraurelia TaxID=5888 RepID=A0CDG1_PARTE|nr:uncharacterized protein GSPATT00007039001 [Paramecium tetraurelia]CAK68828.1 unnamed protein product [Paramecium tetraurelia]|eukprot:XP_001436225.1 hypothetical protein (macronuclear) [Paramecium tetraurelia strain d4-2]